MWHVQSATPGGSSSVDYFATPERAIEAACKILDAGCDVFGIGTGELSDSIDREQIKRIYDIWKRARPRLPR